MCSDLLSDDPPDFHDADHFVFGGDIINESTESSSSKETFFTFIGIHKDDPDREHIFEALMDDARASRDVLCYTRSSLYPHLRHDATVQPPFRLTQISEEAFTRQIGHIYERGRSETKSICDGLIAAVPGLDFWARRWMLDYVVRELEDHNDQHTSVAPHMTITGLEGGPDAFRSSTTSPLAYTDSAMSWLSSCEGLTDGPSLSDTNSEFSLFSPTTPQGAIAILTNGEQETPGPSLASLGIVVQPMARPAVHDAMHQSTAWDWDKTKAGVLESGARSTPSAIHARDVEDCGAPDKESPFAKERCHDTARFKRLDLACGIREDLRDDDRGSCSRSSKTGSPSTSGGEKSVTDRNWSIWRKVLASVGLTT